MVKLTWPGAVPGMPITCCSWPIDPSPTSPSPSTCSTWLIRRVLGYQVSEKILKGKGKTFKLFKWFHTWKVSLIPISYFWSFWVFRYIRSDTISKWWPTVQNWGSWSSSVCSVRSAVHAGHIVLGRSRISVCCRGGTFQNWGGWKCDMKYYQGYFVLVWPVGWWDRYRIWDSRM